MKVVPERRKVPSTMPSSTKVVTERLAPSTAPMSAADTPIITRSVRTKAPRSGSEESPAAPSTRRRTTCSRA